MAGILHLKRLFNKGELENMKVVELQYNSDSYEATLDSKIDWTKPIYIYVYRDYDPNNYLAVRFSICTYIKSFPGEDGPAVNSSHIFAYDADGSTFNAENIFGALEIGNRLQNFVSIDGNEFATEFGLEYQTILTEGDSHFYLIYEEMPKALENINFAYEI